MSRNYPGRASSEGCGAERSSDSRRTQLPVALETRIDEAVEFRLPEPEAHVCAFSLTGQADLVVMVDDFAAGAGEYPINLDDAVDGLLEVFADEPPATPRARAEDAALLRALARRLQSVAARLSREAAKRELGFTAGRHFGG
jgi:hypothetical protein